MTHMPLPRKGKSYANPLSAKTTWRSVKLSGFNVLMIFSPTGISFGNVPPLPSTFNLPRVRQQHMVLIMEFWRGRHMEALLIVLLNPPAHHLLNPRLPLEPVHMY